MAKRINPVSARGLALRESEWIELDAIAAKHGATLSSLITLLARHGRDEMRAGRLKLKTKGKKFVNEADA